jgi:hypothetical protein
MQTVSFETAKKLKEAGFPQPSEVDRANRWRLFYLEEVDDQSGYGPYSADRIEDMRTFDDPGEVVAYAPTAIELLPEGWRLEKEGEEWVCSGITNTPVRIVNKNSAEATASAWIYENQKHSHVDG